MGRKEKKKNLLELIRKCVESGKYLDTRHSGKRQREREIARPEVLYVLRNGFHEKRKDQYNEEYTEWKYSIRGKTVDERLLRVIVSFDPNNMLIITAIELE